MHDATVRPPQMTSDGLRNAQPWLRRPRPPAFAWRGGNARRRHAALIPWRSHGEQR